jgi:hypothetical protein
MANSRFAESSVLLRAATASGFSVIMTFDIGPLAGREITALP